MLRAKPGRKKTKLSANLIIITASRTSTKLSHQTSAAKRKRKLPHHPHHVGTGEVEHQEEGPQPGHEGGQG